jgi:integrase/recombinase XerD
MTPLAPLITGFLRDDMPRQRGYSPQTCETYAVSFKLLLEYAARLRSISEWILVRSLRRSRRSSRRSCAAAGSRRRMH